MQKLKFSIIFLLGFYSSMSAQLHLGNNYGFNVAVVGALGTHVQRFGIMVQGYAITDFAQINASFRVYNNFRNLGPKGEYAEFNAAVGLCLGYGQKTQDENLFISSISNQTSYKNSVAYSYNIWLNKIKTTQVTGIIALQFNHFSMISENDALAKRFLDRFRTGAFLLQYQNKDFQYSVNGTMWTGKMGSGVRNDTIFPEPGYINTENGVYPKLSHGILSAQIKYANEFGQYFQANAGIDAEQIRNVLQNKIVHDLPFFPKKWNKAQNLHFPMIDIKDEQYLYRKEQKIRKPKLFLNGYSSPNVFY